MLDQVLDVFKIKPDYDLNVMKKNQSLFDVTADGLKKLEKVFVKEKPDIVLVQGDTTTTFIASLAAYYLKIKIGHVEAGLRTNDKFNPFPEEINRRLADCLADLYFVHTEKAKQNLLKEGVDKKKIFITGNTVIDALLMTIEKHKDKRIQRELMHRFLSEYRISFNSQKVILVTGHRRESFGKEFENICYGLKKIANSNNDVQIIYPVHLNPNVQKPARKILNNVKNIHLIEPLDYFSFVWLMNQSYLILTDSGGIQEESPSLGKPVLIMRRTTERPEGIEAGTAKLIGTDRKRIFYETMKLLENEKLYQKMAKTTNPYGDGKASERIYDVLISTLKI
jgi:UDP-N-acetylglucosamine 2-epimerase (non-hydrolysing)